MQLSEVDEVKYDAGNDLDLSVLQGPPRQQWNVIIEDASAFPLHPNAKVSGLIGLSSKTSQKRAATGRAIIKKHAYASNGTEQQKRPRAVSSTRDFVDGQHGYDGLDMDLALMKTDSLYSHQKHGNKEASHVAAMLTDKMTARYNKDYIGSDYSDRSDNDTSKNKTVAEDDSDWAPDASRHTRRSSTERRGGQRKRRGATENATAAATLAANMWKKKRGGSRIQLPPQLRDEHVLDVGKKV
jgi:hypothetical protein